MGIVVFYLRNNAEDAEAEQPDWQPQCLAYSDKRSTLSASRTISHQYGRRLEVGDGDPQT